MKASKLITKSVETWNHFFIFSLISWLNSGNWVGSTRRMGLVYGDLTKAFTGDFSINYNVTILQSIETQIRDRFHSESGKCKRKILERLSCWWKIWEQINYTLEDGSSVEPPSPLAWYPNGDAWYFSAPRGAVRREKGMEEFKKFLVSQTDIVSQKTIHFYQLEKCVLAVNHLEWICVDGDWVII